MPRANEPGPGSRLTARTLLPALALLLAGSAPAAAPRAPVPPDGHHDVARPFLQRHCLRCHGATKALAGFRADLLGVDFSAARVADHWKEVLDRLNAGQMPPDGNPRPDVKQSAAFVAWVNDRLRDADRAARDA